MYMNDHKRLIILKVTVNSINKLPKVNQTHKTQWLLEDEKSTWKITIIFLSIFKKFVTVILPSYFSKMKWKLFRKI